MVDRIQVNVYRGIHIKCDGQWAVCLNGSVFDVPSAAAFAPKTIIQLSPGEPAGTLAPHGGPTPVRNVKIKA